MLDKQTAIELAERLGIESAYAFDNRLCVIIHESAILSDEYFTFERMALLALEYCLSVQWYKSYIIVRSGITEIKLPCIGNIDEKKPAYCMAVAKVLIDIKRNWE